MALYPYVATLAVDPVTLVKAAGATGVIYAPADTSFASPLTATDATGNPIPLTANADGILPSFYATSPAVNWRSGSYVFPLVTSVPLPGDKGDKGDDGNDGKDGSNVVPTAQAIATEIQIPGTPANTALSATVAEGVAEGIAERTIVLGPKPSGGDDTAALQAALNKAQSSGGDLHLHPGTYNYTALVTAEAQTQPLIIGRGARRTIMNCTGSGVGIRFRGGAASYSGGGMRDVTLTGANATAIELAAACFMTFERLRFSNLAKGVLFHNQTAGDFTEFDVFKDCRFEANVTQWVEYRVTAGNDSFHGSGFQNCVFNQGFSATGPKFRIGPTARVYNAPLDCVIFGETVGIAFFDTATATAEISTFGHIRIELVTGAYPWANSLPVEWDHAGDILCMSQGVRFNADNTDKFSLVDWRVETSDGSISRKRRPKRTQWNLTTGANNTITLDNGSTALVSIHLRAGNYEYDMLLYVQRNVENNSGIVNVVSNGRAFNSAGYGAPTFAFTNSRLVITNANYPVSGVIARINATEMLGRFNNEMF